MTPSKIQLTPERLALAQAALGDLPEEELEAALNERGRSRPLGDDRDPDGKPHLYVGEDAVGEKCEWCGFGKSHDIHSTARRKAWQKENRIVPDQSDRKWQGASRLEPFLVPIDSLEVGTPVGDITAVALGLAEAGQQNPVPLAADGKVQSSAHIVHAAKQLGWTHVAARSYAAILSTDDSAQTSLLDLMEEAGESLEHVTRVKEAASAEEVNSQTAQANREWEWAGLAEFVQYEDTYKVVVSCRSEEERQALLDALGIAAAYQRKRGPISATWPDYGREAPTVLRFESGDRPDGGKPMEKP